MPGRIWPPAATILPAAPSVTAAEAKPDARLAANAAVPSAPATGMPAARASSLQNEIAISPGLSGLSIALLLWGGVVLIIGVSLGYAAMMVKRIVNRARPLDSEDWLTPLWEVSDRLSLEEPPRLLRSEDAKMPFACGVFRPTIVLPAECDAWTLDRRRAVLLHELAHVRRHDLVGHTLGRLACAVYWFHPLVWTAAKQLRSESERACDDLALACGARAADYAEHLLDIVTSVRRDSTPSVALAMARRKEFEGRMLAILDPELRHVSPSRKQSAALIGSLALISIIVGAAAPAPRASAITRDPGVIASPSAKVDLASDQKQPDVNGYPDSREMVAKTHTHVSSSTTTFQSQQTRTSEVVASSLGDVGDRSAAGALAAALSDASPEVRKRAAWALGNSDLKQAPPQLIALLSDKDPELRELAAWALYEIEDPSSISALETALAREPNK